MKNQSADALMDKVFEAFEGGVDAGDSREALFELHERAQLLDVVQQLLIGANFEYPIETDTGKSTRPVVLLHMPKRTQIGADLRPFLEQCLWLHQRGKLTPQSAPSP